MTNPNAIKNCRPVNPDVPYISSPIGLDNQVENVFILFDLMIYKDKDYPALFLHKGTSWGICMGTLIP